MGQTFHIRNVTTGDMVWESSAGICRRVERLLKAVRRPIPPGIFVEPPLIGDDWSPWYDPEQDKPPERGLSGPAAVREMDDLIAAIHAAPADLPDLDHLREDVALLESLRETFGQSPACEFAGYLYP